VTLRAWKWPFNPLPTVSVETGQVSTAIKSRTCIRKISSSKLSRSKFQSDRRTNIPKMSRLPPFTSVSICQGHLNTRSNCGLLNNAALSTLTSDPHILHIRISVEDTNVASVSKFSKCQYTERYVRNVSLPSICFFACPAYRGTLMIQAEIGHVS
jgi:hypothetical protein